MSSGMLRALAVFSLGTFVVLLAISTFAPLKRGSLGFSVVTLSSWPVGSGSTFVAEHVSPNGPAARVGLRNADVLRLDLMDVDQRRALLHPLAGPVAIAFEHDGRLRTGVVIPAEPLSARFSWDIVLRLAFAFVYLCVAVLVAWKAAQRIESTLIVLFLIGLAMTAVLGSLRSVMPTMDGREWVMAVREGTVALLFICQFLFPAVFPPRDTLARRWILRIGLPVTIIYAIVSAFREYETVFLVGAAVIEPARNLLGIIFECVVIAAVVDGIRSTSARYRVQAISAGSTLVALSLVFIVSHAGNLIMNTNVFFGSDIINLIPYAAGLGMTYAVLRHRLLDLGVIVSRAAIFSIVSFVLVLAFALAEWAIAFVIEHSLGSRFEGETQVGIAVGTALAVGLSARSVHEILSHRLNRIFFAKRYRALRDLHRFMLETDSATDAAALMDLTMVVLERHTDATYLALYLGDPTAGYSLLQTGSPTGTPHLRPSDEMVLRLRRWGETYVEDVPGSAFQRALVCPMMLRGTLFGFVVCGPKREGTSYLEDEREALSALVHRVGIAHEWLTRPLASRTPTLPAFPVRP